MLLMAEVSDDFELNQRVEDWKGNMCDQTLERVVDRMSELFTLEASPSRLKAVWFAARTLGDGQSTAWNIAHLLSDMLTGEAYADDWGPWYTEQYKIYCVQHDIEFVY
jgi:hypothetical protein